MDLKTNVQNEILHVSFNQDNTCLAVGTQTGFFVCDTNPLNLRFTRRTETALNGSFEVPIPPFSESRP